NLEQSGSVTAGVRNAVVVVDADGAATFSGSVANYTAEEITVELEGLVEGAVVFSTQVAVPAGDVVELGSGPDQQAVSIGELDVAPGELMDLAVSWDGESTEITMPVTDNTLGYFEQGAARTRRRESAPEPCSGALRTSRGGSGAAGFELVAQAPHGHQVHRVPRVLLDLGAQALDVHIQGLGVADVVGPPDPVDQLT